MAHEIRPSQCTCGVLLWDKHTRQVVKPGHFIVCIYCGQILLLNEELRGLPIDISNVPEELQPQLMAMQSTARIVGPMYRRQLELRRKRDN